MKISKKTKKKTEKHKEIISQPLQNVILKST